MTWDFQQCGMCDQQRLRSACAYAQSDQSLCLSLEFSMTLRLLAEHQLEFLSLKEGCTGSYESTRVKMTHYWKSHVLAHNLLQLYFSGPPSLINLQDTLKRVLFEYHQNTVSGSIHHNTHKKTDKERRGVIGPDPNKMIPGDTPPTKWPVVL